MLWRRLVDRLILVQIIDSTLARACVSSTHQAPRPLPPTTRVALARRPFVPVLAAPAAKLRARGNPAAPPAHRVLISARIDPVFSLKF